jgi:hypothetical protein
MAIAATLKAYERHISAAAMIGGFVVDNLAFGRIDHPATQIVLASYLVVAAASIAILHYFGEHAELAGTRYRWAAIVSGVTQFCFGGLWSAFLIFYSRSAVIETAWPFLLILALIFLGNEVFREYRSRLVFTAILLFFALFSFSTFIVPVFTGTIGHRMFLISGGAAVAIFAAFVTLLAFLARSRMRRDIKKIAAGAIFVYVALNSFYYMNVLPPLPLALVDSGIFYSRAEVAWKYRNPTQIQPWYKRIDQPSTYYLKPGQPLYAYSAVFAPIRLTTQIVHEWDWYDTAKGGWVTQSVIRFPITGGRDSGYKGFSDKTNLRPGSWRVDVETDEGRVIERMNFTVVFGAAPKSGAL